MVKQVKAVYSESKQEQSEKKTKVKVEHESYELEQRFYENIKSNESDNFRGKVHGRGSYRGKYKDNEKKRVKGKKATDRKKRRNFEV